MTAILSLLRDANIRFLEQGAELLESLPESIYASTQPPLYPSGVGGHMRHCIDHYHAFLSGLPSGRIDYDARERDRTLEQSPAAAARTLRHLALSLTRLDLDQPPRTVSSKVDCGGEDVAAMWADSTVARELQFLLSHTVHHFALIALILRLQGVGLPAGFGKAPSTLRHEGLPTPCAR